MRTAEDLYRTPPAQMTDEEFTAHRVQSYYRAEDSPGVPCRRFSLLQFTGMTADEYAEWIMEGTVSERFMRANGRRGTR